MLPLGSLLRRCWAGLSRRLFDHWSSQITVCERINLNLDMESANLSHLNLYLWLLAPRLSPICPNIVFLWCSIRTAAQ